MAEAEGRRRPALRSWQIDRHMGRARGGGGQQQPVLQ